MSLTHTPRRALRRAVTALALTGTVLAAAGTGTAGADPYTNHQWASFNGGATPGMTLAVTGENDSLIRCTAAFAGQDGNGDAVMFTAGHCFPSTARSYADYTVAGETALSRLGTVTTTQSRQTPEDKRTVKGVSDFSILDLAGDVTVNPKIADTYTVTKVMAPSELVGGMTVCKYGYRTEETCGPVISGDDNMVRVGLYSLTGDSGAPAYVKLGGTEVAAVGLLSSSPKLGDYTDDYVTDFALLAPILLEEGITLTSTTATPVTDDTDA